jgi:hypothetical protein
MTELTISQFVATMTIMWNDLLLHWEISETTHQNGLRGEELEYFNQKLKLSNDILFSIQSKACGKLSRRC